MDCRYLKDELTKLISGGVYLDEPMSRHTTWRIGGPADLLVIPKTTEEVRTVLQLAREQEIPCTVVGNGSNLLVRDKGVRGIVLKISPGLNEVQVKGLLLTAGAGALLPRLARIMLKNRLSGLEFAAAIPASLGGAVVMNAGAYGAQIGDLVREVTLINPVGELETLTVRDLSFGYRRSNLLGRGTIVEAVLEGRRAEYQAIRELMLSNIRHRQNTQPFGWPNAGSVFKNPGDLAAGRILDEAGAKGLRCGAAAVSDKHANFIVNTGGATAVDVLTLIKILQELAADHVGLQLEPEVKIIGED